MAVWQDDFNNSSLDAAKFGTSVAGATVVTEGTDYLTLDEGTATSDAGIIYLQAKLDQSKPEILIHKVKIVSIQAGAVAHLFSVVNKSTAPAVDTNTNFNPLLRVQVTQAQADGGIRVLYYDTGGTPQYWTGSGWSPTPTIATAGTIGTWYIFQFVHTLTQWKIIVLSGDGAKERAHTDWLNFSALKSSSADLWAFWGDPYTNFYYMDLQSDYVRYGDAAGVVGFYNGWAPTGGADYRIGRAISYDGGATFVRDPVAAIVEKAAFQAGENVAHVKDPYVILDGSTYYLWCSHYDSAAAKYSISCFTSANGISWTRSGTAAKLAPGGTGAPDENGCSFPVVVKDINAADPNQRWKIYYAGASSTGKLTICLGYADSPTGTYAKHGTNPVLDVGGAGAFDEDVVLPTNLLVDGTTLRLYYGGGYNTAANRWYVGEATSQDWLTWTREPANPILQSRSAVTTSITTLASGAIVATVGSTANFIAKECVVLLSSNEATSQLARIETIDSGTQVTLSYPASASFNGGKMKSLYFGSVFPAKVEKAGSTYRMWPVAFQHRDGAGFTLEVTGYAEGAAHNAFAYNLTQVPALPLGQSWDAVSAENFRGVGVPTDFVSGVPVARKFFLDVMADGSASRKFVIPLDWSGAIGRTYAMPFSFEALVPVARAFPLEVEALAGLSRRYPLPFESDGDIVLVRRFALPVETTAMLGRKLPLPVESSAGILSRQFFLPVEIRGGIGRPMYCPIEWSGDRVIRRKFALPFETKQRLARKLGLPVEASGLTDALSDVWRVYRKLSELFLDEWTVIPVAQTVDFLDSWTVKSAMGMELIDTWRVLPQQIITLFSGDIQLPSATMEKS